MSYTVETTSAYKNMRNEWNAETVVKMNDSNRVIKFVTMKRSSGKLVTNCHAATIQGNMESWMPFSDFSETLFTTEGRVTERKVNEQHAGVTSKIPEIVERMKAFYEKNKEDDSVKMSRQV